MEGDNNPDPRTQTYTDGEGCREEGVYTQRVMFKPTYRDRALQLNRDPVLGQSGRFIVCPCDVKSQPMRSHDLFSNDIMKL